MEFDMGGVVMPVVVYLLIPILIRKCLRCLFLLQPI